MSVTVLERLAARAVARRGLRAAAGRAKPRSEGCVGGEGEAADLEVDAHDLDLFLRRITRGARTSLPVGELVAICPPSPEHDWGDVALYIGKVTSGDAASVKEG